MTGYRKVSWRRGLLNRDLNDQKRLVLGDVMEGHSRPENSQCKGPVVGSKVRIFEEQKEDQCCWMGIRGVQGDVAGQVGTGLIRLPCRQGAWVAQLVKQLPSA